MDQTKVNQQQKDQQNKKQQEGPMSEDVKSFTPLASSIRPVPPQPPNVLQRMQELPENEKSTKLKPNLIQQIQRKKEEEKKLQLKREEEEKPSQLKKDEEEKTVQAKLQLKQSPETPVTSGNSGSGNKMPGELQTKMEGSFGADFSDVKIHSDSDKAPALNALAYTQGTDIHFAPGQFNPSSKQGQELIGHELTHVLQQKQGRVQSTTQLKGAEINDSPELEQEADDMGKKAASGEKVKGPQSPSGGIQLKALDADKVEPYFKDYETFAQNQLDQWYSKSSIEDDDKLTGAMFAKAARKIYDEKKDLSYVVPVEYALAQARLEGGLMGKERTKGNIFNVGAFDSGVSGTEQAINEKEKGFDSYYKLMADSFLKNKTADQLLENGNFTTKSGGVYATNPFYEIEIKAEIGSMHYDSSQHVLSASVGKGKTNNPKDVEFIGGMLAQLGYISKDKVKDANAVCDGILEFQKKEMAPEDEEWFKNRMKGVTNSQDQDSMKQKAKNMTDGVVGKNGPTVGLLYFKTYLSGKIPSTHDGTASATTSTNAAAAPKEASWTEKIVNAGMDAYNYLFGSNESKTKPAPKADTTVLVGVADGKQVGSKEEAVRIQSSLKLLGYYQGTADGYLTKKDGSESDTIKAIKKFQSDNKLSSTGNVDGATNAAITTAVAAKSASSNTTPAPASTNNQNGTTSNTAATPVKDKAAEKSAKAIYQQYDGEMLAIGKEMLKYVKSDPNFVISMLDYLSWYEKDNLAYNLSSHLSESDLASVDKQLVQRLYNELSNGYTSDLEQKQMDKLSKFIAKKQEETKEVKNDDKAAYKNTDFNLSDSVGKGGKNKAKDVLKVQNLLISLNYLSASNAEYTDVKTTFAQTPDKVILESKLTETIKAIKQYQKYGATTKNTITTQDGLISKNGYTHTSMKEINRVYNDYDDKKFEDQIDEVLTNDQWRGQFRWGFNFDDDDDEKEYMDYVKELTGYDEPGDLYNATAEQIADVKAKYHGHKSFWFDELKTQAIKTSQKARPTKPNEVCCWDTANLMLGFTGTSEKGENYKIQTFVKDASAGKFTNQAALGVKYIDAQLKAGKAVFVGIDKGDYHPDRNEAVTDHYILIIAKKKDGDKWYYRYFDPGRSKKDAGTNADNRLYIGADKKTVENGSNKLSQVRVNNE